MRIKIRRTLKTRTERSEIEAVLYDGTARALATRSHSYKSKQKHSNSEQNVLEKERKTYISRLA